MGGEEEMRSKGMVWRTKKKNSKEAVDKQQGVDQKEGSAPLVYELAKRYAGKK